MRLLELIFHFLQEGVVYLAVSAFLAAGLHWLMRDFTRACIWATVVAVSLLEITVLCSGGSIEPIAISILCIFGVAFFAVAALVGVPFVLIRRRKRGSQVA